MQLQYKPDLDRARLYWRAFWEHQIIDRPVVCVTAPLDGAPPVDPAPYLAGFDGDYEGALQLFDRWAASRYFGGEALPCYEATFGPDQFAAFFGAGLHIAEDHSTSWVQPYVTDWAAVDLTLDNSPTGAWQRMLDYLRRAAAFSEGKFLISMLDLHSNLDCLSALRGPQNLCMDLVDCPGEVERVLNQARQAYPQIFQAIWQAGGMEHRGGLGWLNAYSETPFAVVQCDFICMIGPRHARRLAIPAIAEEAAFLDHCVYHYDGPQALRHLDDILAVPDIDVIQWVPGAGQPRSVEWLDLLKKIQAAGKGLWLFDWTADEIRQYSKELRPEGLCFDLQVGSQAEAEALLDWLKKNT